MPAVERRLLAEDRLLAGVLRGPVEGRRGAAFEHIGAGGIDVGIIGAERPALVVVAPVRRDDKKARPIAEAASTASAHSRTRSRVSQAPLRKVSMNAPIGPPESGKALAAQP